MTTFTPWLSPWLSLAGGALIGLSAILLMALHGRIAGLSGIVAAILQPVARDWAWRGAFLAGAVAAPALVIATSGRDLPFDSPTPALWLAIGGVMVGAGVSFGGGCTSGHGICGNARGSRRSIVATLTFMATAAATVFVIRHILGGF